MDGSRFIVSRVEQRDQRNMREKPVQIAPSYSSPSITLEMASGCFGGVSGILPHKNVFIL
jgi:hypothetical protein